MTRYDFEVIGSEDEIQLRRITNEGHVKGQWGVGVPGTGGEVHEVYLSFPDRDDSTIAALLRVPHPGEILYEMQGDSLVATHDPDSDYYWTDYSRRLYEVLQREIEHGKRN